MALLSVDKRKEYFSYLKIGAYNKENIKKFQAKHFSRKSDIDGLYGTNTDKLLRHVYNVTRYTNNFKPTEFKCECGGKYCSGYPSWMKKVELEHIQSIRDYYKRPMQVTCGLRCTGYNRALNGSIQNSLHLTGYAVDFYMAGVTDTLANRKKSIKWIKKRPNHHYTYGNGINSYGVAVSAPYMGNALHTDTQEPPAPKPTPTPTKQGYTGSYPTSAEIKSASNTGTKERICQWAKKIADSGEYKYKVWTDDVKTHQCPICKNLTGKYKGWNCIGYSWACWHHGGQIPCKCNCGVIDNGTGDKMLKAKTVAAATKMVQDHADIDDVKVIRNLKTIPSSDLQKGDILQYYNGNTYIHSLVYVGGNKIADSSRGHTPQVKYGVAYQQKYCKIAIRYTGGKTYLQKYDKGEAVKKIQKYLNWYGNKLTVDGIFGEETTKAVKAFQKAQSLSQDGIVGQKTIDAMKKVKK